MRYRRFYPLVIAKALSNRVSNLRTDALQAMTLPTIGSIARLITFEKGIVSPMYICFRTKGCATPEYLDYFFESKLFFTEIQKGLEGSVRQCLSYESLCNIPFPLLAIEVQRRIGKQLFTLVQKIKLETDFLEILHKQKQYLLRQMFI